MKIEAINITDREEAEDVWALQHAAYRVEAALIGVADLPPLRDTADSLRKSEETFFGMRGPDGELAGAASIEPQEGGGYTLCRLMVHPDWFRRGIGSRLLNHVLALYPEAPWTVTAADLNAPALALYAKAGFVPRESFEPSPGITLVRLERRS